MSLLSFILADLAVGSILQGIEDIKEKIDKIGGEDEQD